MKKILARALWRVLPDPEGKLPIRYVQCRECDERSTVSAAQAVGDLWAMQHSAGKGHTRYREFAAIDIVTKCDREGRS